MYQQSATSKNMASITILNMVNRPVMSKQTRESVLSDRVDKIENTVIVFNEKMKS